MMAWEEGQMQRTFGCTRRDGQLREAAAARCSFSARAACARDGGGREGRRSGERGGTRGRFLVAWNRKGVCKCDVNCSSCEAALQQPILLHKQAKIGTKKTKNCREQQKFTVADAFVTEAAARKHGSPPFLAPRFHPLLSPLERYVRFNHL